MTTDTGTRARRGGDWLIDDADPGGVFTPERLSEDHRLVGQTATEFITNEVAPALDALERKEWTEVRRLLARCGELGLIGVDTPEDVGGVGMDKAASIVVGEAVGATASFATSFGAQTGLAIIPILCFGTPDQQQRYLPGILAGTTVGAYCLSEASSGSDALAARAKATRAPDGGWILNGEKLWITNGGFADLFIVFAKVDGEQFSAFLVERGFPGVSHGQEEHKMGLLGSSTTPVILADARVPAENLLGEVGRGHKIAFNVLNYGRFKLGAMCSGGAKAAIAEAVQYAAARRQFGQPLTAFGAIQHKLGEMAIREYVVESMLYRTAGLIDERIAATGHDPASMAAALEEFAIEASLLKVAGSEMVDFVVDEDVQIHGGNGFVRDYPAERRYRDSRVNRIFEGTNEINRLLVPGLVIKRALKGGPAVLAAAAALRDELLGGTLPAPADPGDPRLAAAARAVAAVRRAALLTLGLAAQTFGEKLADQQEVLMLTADLCLDAFGAQSALRRAAQAAAAGHPIAAAHVDAATVAALDAAGRADIGARTAVTATVDGDDRRTALAALRRIFKGDPEDTVAARRRVAALVIERKGYPFA
ncbi:MAG: acyl-CoA dehydrogenase family protein [Vicinamibacterales bacterium]